MHLFGGRRKGTSNNKNTASSAGSKPDKEGSDGGTPYATKQPSPADSAPASEQEKPAAGAASSERDHHEEKASGDGSKGISGGLAHSTGLPGNNASPSGALPGKDTPGPEAGKNAPSVFDNIQQAGSTTGFQFPDPYDDEEKKPATPGSGHSSNGAQSSAFSSNSPDTSDDSFLSHSVGTPSSIPIPRWPIPPWSHGSVDGHGGGDINDLTNPRGSPGFRIQKLQEDSEQQAKRLERHERQLRDHERQLKSHERDIGKIQQADEQLSNLGGGEIHKLQSRSAAQGEFFQSLRDGTNAGFDKLWDQLLNLGQATNGELKDLQETTAAQGQAIRDLTNKADAAAAAAAAASADASAAATATAAVDATADTAATAANARNGQEPPPGPPGEQGNDEARNNWDDMMQRRLDAIRADVARRRRGAGTEAAAPAAGSSLARFNGRATGVFATFFGVSVRVFLAFLLCIVMGVVLIKTFDNALESWSSMKKTWHERSQ
ncbi:hypothetical protein PG989_000809 [Apiospora arundinis]